MLVYAKHLLKGLSQGKPGPLKALGYYSRWKEYQKETHSSMSDRLPWLTFSAIEYLKAHVGKEAMVFEYGGGGSTLFFMDKGAHVVTVEHHPEWFAALQQKLQPFGDRWEGYLVEPQPITPGSLTDPANPDAYYSKDEPYPLQYFRNYVSVIDRYPDEHFDIVLIDGRGRTSCIKHAVRKVKKGGLLVLDNAEREYYLSHNHHNLAGFQLVVNAWGPVPFNTFFSQTNIWVKSV